MTVLHFRSLLDNLQGNIYTYVLNIKVCLFIRWIRISNSTTLLRTLMKYSNNDIYYLIPDFQGSENAILVQVHKRMYVELEQKQECKIPLEWFNVCGISVMFARVGVPDPKPCSISYLPSEEQKLLACQPQQFVQVGRSGTEKCALLL